MSEGISFARQFVRSVVASKVSGGDTESLHKYVNERWPHCSPDLIEKAAVGALTQSQTHGRVAEGFLDAVRARTALGRLPFRRTAFNVRSVAATVGARGYWVGEAQPIPLSKPALEGVSLPARKVGAIVAVTEESLHDLSPITESGLQRDLEIAVASAVDEALFLPSNAGIPNERPASILYGAPTVVSTGDLRTDIEALADAYAGDWSTAAIVTSPRIGMQAALRADITGHADIGPNGGTMFGLPVFTTGALDGGGAGDWIALVDCARIAFAMDGITLGSSGVTTLAMADDPDSPAEMVSMFQTNTVALRAAVSANWVAVGSGSVVVVSGADYSGSASP